MRELKFKAWDKKYKRWCNSRLVYSEGIWWTWKKDCVLTLHTDDYDIIQFTGLLDKNGKEIWESDIVVKDSYIWFDEEKPNYRGTVEWIYSQWQVVAHCVNSDKQGISDGINEGINEEGIEEGEKTDWRVIGNIYENPELLIGQNENS